MSRRAVQVLSYLSKQSYLNRFSFNTVRLYSEKSKEEMDQLKENPYFGKYAHKIQKKKE